MESGWIRLSTADNSINKTNVIVIDPILTNSREKFILDVLKVHLKKITYYLFIKNENMDTKLEAIEGIPADKILDKAKVTYVAEEDGEDKKEKVASEEGTLR